jgi:hypothetical protein
MIDEGILLVLFLCLWTFNEAFVGLDRWLLISACFLIYAINKGVTMYRERHHAANVPLTPDPISPSVPPETNTP